MGKSPHTLSWEAALFFRRKRVFSSRWHGPSDLSQRASILYFQGIRMKKAVRARGQERGDETP